MTAIPIKINPIVFLATSQTTVCCPKCCAKHHVALPDGKPRESGEAGYLTCSSCGVAIPLFVSLAS